MKAGALIMGSLFNPGNTEFTESVNAEIYIDKTELIDYANKVLRTPQKYICVSRPRRFGKSTAANMLTAYYSKGCDSRELFAPYTSTRVNVMAVGHAVNMGSRAVGLIYRNE